MADIKIRVAGEDAASSALASASQSVRESAKALDVASKAAVDNSKSTAILNNVYAELINVAKEAGKAFVDFTKESLTAYKESERLTAQLRLTAGGLTDAFKEQAGAMQEALGVDDDMVVKMQTMLLRFGEAPEKIGGTVKALLDYSAATGNDAVGATQELLSSVESGRAAFKELGLQYQLTGEASKDVEELTRSLTGAVGGAADTDANTLIGHTNKAARAIDDLKKSFGGLIIEMEQKLGLMKSVAEALGEIAKNVRMSIGLGKAFAASIGGQYAGGASPREIDANLPGTALGIIGDFARNPNAYAGGGDAGAAAINRPAGFRDRSTAAGRRGSNGTVRGDGKLRDDPEGTDTTTGAFLDRALEIRKEYMAEEATRVKAINDLWDTVDSEEEKRMKEEREHQNQLMKEQVEAAKKWEDKWAQAGQDLGYAFVNSITSELAKLQDGGEFDLGKFVLGAVSLVAQGVATLYGGPLAGAAVGAGMQLIQGAASGGSKAKKHHEGGFVERFHSGGWPGGLSSDEVPIIAQSGEAVLSRRDVANMGGRQGVESAKQGGAVNVYVSTMDGTTMRETFERAGGRAIFNAIRTGRGSLIPLFGGT